MSEKIISMIFAWLVNATKGKRINEIKTIPTVGYWNSEIDTFWIIVFNENLLIKNFPNSKHPKKIIIDIKSEMNGCKIYELIF